MSLVRALRTFKDPRYTGAKRCLPCTGVNTALLALAAVGIAAAGFPYAAVAVLLVGLLVLYFKGYVVPGTPTLTKRYLPDSALALFDHSPNEDNRTTMESTAETATDEETPLDIEAVLLDVGVLRPTAGGRDFERTESFTTAYRDRLADLRHAPDEQTIHALLETEDVPGDADVSLGRLGETVVFTVEDTSAGTWPSYAAFLGDAAAADVLTEFDPRWPERPLGERARLLRGIRIWAEHCPRCGGKVTLDAETRSSCCRDIEIAAATCEHCGARVFETELP